MITWYGRKARLLDWLLPRLPGPRDRFVDAFGGTGSVILARDQAPGGEDVWIDADPALGTMFRMLQHPQTAANLIAQATLTPWHRAEFDRALTTIDLANGGIEPAWSAYALSETGTTEAIRQFLVWVVQRTIGAGHDPSMPPRSIPGSPDTGGTDVWRYSVTLRSRLSREWQALLRLLEERQPRIREIDFRTGDALKLLPTLAGADTLVYLDPPYLGFGDFYRAHFHDELHEVLADLAHDLHRAGTAVAISGYRSPDYDRWFRGWYRWDDDGGPRVPLGERPARAEPPMSTNSVPVQWYGGKNRPGVLAWLLPLLPPMPVYVEPFGGSGVVLLARERAAIRDVYNDLNTEIVTLYRALQREDVDLLLAETYLTPWHRGELARALATRGDQALGERELARRALVALRQGRGGQTDRNTATCFSYSVQKAGSRHWPTILDRVPRIVPRVRQWTIEQRDALEVLAAHDDRDTLFYVDPPYLNADQAYAHRFPPERHEQLADVLHQTQGLVAISGYRTPEYDRWFRGWYRYDLTHRDRVESLWCNYNPAAYYPGANR